MKNYDEKTSNGGKEHEPRQRDILVGLANDIELFHTPNGGAYAEIQFDSHRETWAVRSAEFQHWLRRRFFEKTRKVVNSQTLRESLAEFKAMARFDGREQEVSLRVANLDDTIYIDMCHQSWQAIEVDVNGWRAVDAPSVKFIRKPGMKSLPHPVACSDINILRKFLNVSSESFVLAVSWILAAVCNKKGFPQLVVNGCASSSKSTFSHFIRLVIDPNTAPILMLPQNSAEMLRNSNCSHIIAYDNLSKISSRFSDVLCQISTGAYLNMESASKKEFLSSVTSPTILSGIEFSTKSDLSNRAIFVTLDPIPKEERKSDSELWRGFEAEHPRILGALLHDLVEGLRNVNEARNRLPYLPRMADFALFSAATETAFWPEGTFWKAYSRNMNEAAEDIIEADTLADRLCSFIAMQPSKVWSGTATNLFIALTAGRGVRDFPPTPAKLGGALRRLVVPLSEIGIHVEFKKEGNRKRIIRIWVDEDSGSSAPQDNLIPIRSGDGAGASHSSSIGVQPAQGCIEGNLAVVVSGHGLETEESIQTVSNDNKQDALPEVEITLQPDNDNCHTGNLPAIIHYEEGRVNIQPRTIYQGDNLSILRQMGTAAVDLIATDPPFNTGKEWKGKAGSFDDRFESVKVYVERIRKRVVEMHRVLKPDGSIYLHCDPSISHHLRKLMDEIFGEKNFRREIVWNLETASGYKSQVNGYIRGHDTILYYTKSNKFTFNKQYKEYKPEYIKRMFKKDENGRLYRTQHGGRIYYLDEMKGVALTDVWSDIKPFQVISNSNEFVNYPTQKPVELYERIIKASSNKGDVVLDVFCGSGTTLVAAEKLGRNWIGSDLSTDACKVTQRRFEDVQTNLNGFDTPPPTGCEEGQDEIPEEDNDNARIEDDLPEREDGGRAALPDETSNDNETSRETRRRKRAR